MFHNTNGISRVRFYYENDCILKYFLLKNNLLKFIFNIITLNNLKSIKK
jgi:hypothetical protein